MIQVFGAHGENIKKYNVVVDYSQHYVLLPVVPGSEDIDPIFELEDGAEAEKLSGPDADSHMKYRFSNGAESEEWTVRVVEWGNSILGQYGFFADAEAEIFDGKYYIYPTSDGFEGWGGHYFKAFSSPDLVSWHDEGVILDLKSDVSWSDGNAWAPCIVRKNGKYYYYFSANTNNFEINVGKAIGVAVCDTPAGKFRDALGRPLVYDKMTLPDGAQMRFPGQVIDPAVFTDPETGKSYLYWGNGSMWACELGEDMTSLKGDIVNITPPNFREAAHVFYRKGIYYFTWSEDDTRSKNYHVRWGYSNSPMGPIIGNEVLIERNDALGIYGTGHHTVINVPGGDDWYICYHRFNFPSRMDGEESEYYGTHRELALDKMEFDSEGKIKKVVPTLEGVSKGEPVLYFAKIASVSPLDEIDEGGEINASVEVQSGECETDVDIIMELYDYQSNLVATTSERCMVSEFETKKCELSIIAPEKMRGHYLAFFMDDGDELIRLTY